MTPTAAQVASDGPYCIIVLSSTAAGVHVVNVEFGFEATSLLNPVHCDFSLFQAGWVISMQSDQIPPCD